MIKKPTESSPTLTQLKLKNLLSTLYKVDVIVTSLSDYDMVACVNISCVNKTSWKYQPKQLNAGIRTF